MYERSLKYFIHLIQGDSLKRLVEVKSDGRKIPPEEIDHIYFSSTQLDITKELIYDTESESYILTFNSNETNTFPPGKYTYDLTLYFSGSAIETCVYNGDIKIYPKDNEVDIDE